MTHAPHTQPQALRRHTSSSLPICAAHPPDTTLLLSGTTATTTPPLMTIPNATLTAPASRRPPIPSEATPDPHLLTASVPGTSWPPCQSAGACLAAPVRAVPPPRAWAAAAAAPACRQPGF